MGSHLCSPLESMSPCLCWNSVASLRIQISRNGGDQPIPAAHCCTDQSSLPPEQHNKEKLHSNFPFHHLSAGSPQWRLTLISCQLFLESIFIYYSNIIQPLASTAHSLTWLEKFAHKRLEATSLKCGPSMMEQVETL